MHAGYQQNLYKSQILQAARELFSEYGYSRVSMRDIAERSGISVGNLTYHFHRKEDLIEAIVDEMQNARNKSLSPPTDLYELDMLISKNAETITRNICYFRDYTQFSHLSKKIYNIQREMIDYHFSLWRKVFCNLNKVGFIIDEVYEGQFENLITAILLTTRHWSSHAKLAEDFGYEFTDLRDCIWSLIFPILTIKGQNLYLNKIKNDKEE